MGDFIKAKFDNLCLFAAMGMLAGLILHLAHHDPDSSTLTWATQTFTTVLGAYIGLTQAARLPWNKNGGTNGNTPQAPQPTTPSSTNTGHL